MHTEHCQDCHHLAEDCICPSIAKQVLRDLRANLQKRSWLIECGGSYYCGPGEWCNNVRHAKRYVFKTAAETVASRMGEMVGGPAVAVEHVWE